MLIYTAVIPCSILYNVCCYLKHNAKELTQSTDREQLCVLYNSRILKAIIALNIMNQLHFVMDTYHDISEVVI
jgi:hypothetical protein